MVYCFFTFSFLMSKRLIYLSDDHAKSEAFISGQWVDSMTNASNTGIFARRNYELSRIENSLLETRDKFQKKELFLVTIHSIQGAIIAVMLAFMIYFLIHLYAHHKVTIRDFVLILWLSMDVTYTISHTM